MWYDQYRSLSNSNKTSVTDLEFAHSESLPPALLVHAIAENEGRQLGKCLSFLHNIETKMESIEKKVESERKELRDRGKAVELKLLGSSVN